MRRRDIAGMIAAILLGLGPAHADAWSGSTPFSGPPARVDAGTGSARYGSPFAAPPLGERQNEAWGQYLNRQYFLNHRTPASPHGRSHRPDWAWVAPSWQWNGLQWVWVPGYWVPYR